jgi:hypothetical protein
MNIVNELFQSLRLLKCYGWGQLYPPFYLLSMLDGDYRKFMGIKSCQRTRRRTQVESAGEYRCNYHRFHLVGVLRISSATNLTSARTWIPSATALSTFLCYTLLAGEKLSVSKAFTAIALFSYLQEPMTALPGQVFALLNGMHSLDPR